MEKTLFDKQKVLPQAEDVPKSATDGFVNFSIGAPSEYLLPVELARRCLNASLPSNFTSGLQYGPSCGDGEVKMYLAEWLNREYMQIYEKGCKPVREHDLILTCGASQSLANMITLFCDPNYTTILFEDPTYFLAKGLFDDISQKFKFKTIPQESDGLDTLYLENVLKSTNGKPPPLSDLGKFPYFLYCVPTFNNPTSSVLSGDKRRKIAQLAKDYNILVVCDDVYDLLKYDQGLLPCDRIVSYDEDEDGRIISNCSFSKVFGPGLRCGWMEVRGRALRELLSRQGVLSSGGGMSHFTFNILLLPALKERWMEEYLEQLRAKMKRKRDILCSVLSQRSQGRFELQKPIGGYFIWVKLSNSYNSADLRQIAIKKHAVGFSPGIWFSPISKLNSNCIRLSFAFYEEQELAAGAVRLCEFLESI